MNTENKEIFEFFGRHLVALSLAFRIQDHDPQSKPALRVYSGTLIRFGTEVFYLTSGHGLREIIEINSSDKFFDKEMLLVDTFAKDRVSDYAIPFSLDRKRAFFIDDENEGLDFGLVHLIPYYVRLLAKNNVAAISEVNWVRQHKIDFNIYWMLGFPDENSASHLDDFGAADISPMLIQVYPLAPGEKDERWSDFWFTGKVGSNLPISSLSGMSGGPILGFKVEEKVIRYWLVALQSGWNRGTRHVYGCSIPRLAGLVAAEIDRLKIT